MDKATLEAWQRRGVVDARRGRNALMWPTRNGVFYDIMPDWDYDDVEAKQIATAYYNGYCTAINPEEHHASRT